MPCKDGGAQLTCKGQLEAHSAAIHLSENDGQGANACLTLYVWSTVRLYARRLDQIRYRYEYE